MSRVILLKHVLQINIIKLRPKSFSDHLMIASFTYSNNFTNRNKKNMDQLNHLTIMQRFPLIIRGLSSLKSFNSSLMVLFDVDRNILETYPLNNDFQKFF